jgi:CheY-like chemotaxis protein/putative methionine-R-sulfoxide reductase with GAF domain
MSIAATNQPRILLLNSSDSKTAALFSLLNKHLEVRVVDNVEKAVEAIQSGSVDVVVSETGDFLPGQCEQCSRWVRRALNATGEGMVGVLLDGQIAWANAAMRAMPQEVLRGVVMTCFDAACEWARAEQADMADRQGIHTLSVPDAAGEMSDYELAVSPVVDDQGKLIQVAAVVRDITAAQRFQRRIQAVEQAGQQLVRFDAEQFTNLSAPQRVEKIEKQIAAYSHSLMQFDRFSIRLLNRKTGRLAVVMAQGMADCVFNRELTASVEGQGISGFVAATGRSYICVDSSRDPRYLPGINNAGSSLTVPLWLHDEVVGVFNVESGRLAAFDDVDRRLLEAFGRHVAIALNILDLLVVERYRTTGQLADDVSSEIAAPLNDIVTDATSLMAEYDNPALVARLEAITRNVDLIRQAVRLMARPINGYGKAVQEGPTRDPLLIGKRILVADDEEAIRQTVQEVLRKQGCQVDTARDGAEAISMISIHGYDLVLADIRMPHKNGYEVFAAAKEHDPDCQVVLITGFGYDPNHTIIRARKEGLAAVLFKPFKVDRLLTEVRQALKNTPTHAHAEQPVTS